MAGSHFGSIPLYPSMLHHVIGFVCRPSGRMFQSQSITLGHVVELSRSATSTLVFRAHV